MRLVVVESPNKTRKIRDFLGPGYRVAASFGHVRDLPAQGGLAVAFKAGAVLPTYVPIERSQRAVDELRGLAAQAEEVLLATDPDREGEAIAWHVAALLGERPYRRVVFNAITKAAVQQAMAQPRALDRHLIDAQQARRVLDRVVGWLVSPTLRAVGKEARSAGRVQSVALRLVAEREREIQRFTAVDYFVLRATVQHPQRPPPFTAGLVQWKGEPLAQRLTDAAVAQRTVEWCRKQRWQVAACERREQQRQPPPPFTTATVQQAASVRLRLAPERTMQLLQKLFEDGHITYHRTDSTALAPEAVAAARARIAADFPPAYLPAQPVRHASAAANAQEAHEAIRPTHPESGPQALGEDETAELYALIWKRFIACQMAPARDQHTVIDIACAPGAWLPAPTAADPTPAPLPMGVFRAKGVVVLFDGWRRLGGDATDESPAARRGKGKGRKKAAGPATAASAEPAEEDAGELPLLAVGDAVDLLDLAARQHTTKPPPRYTQAGLIKRLEHDGIGRPSTYATIMRTILERGYVAERKRVLHATDLGLAVCDFLVRHYSGNFIDLDYTARLEADLDRVAAGQADWQRVVTTAAEAVLALAQRAGLRGDPLHG